MLVLMIIPLVKYLHVCGKFSGLWNWGIIGSGKLSKFNIGNWRIWLLGLMLKVGN